MTENIYESYLRMKTILDLFSECKYVTAHQIIKKTKIPTTSAYRLLKVLLENNVIVVSGRYDTSTGKKEKGYKLSKTTKKEKDSEGKNS